MAVRISPWVRSARRQAVGRGQPGWLGRRLRHGLAPSRKSRPSGGGRVASSAGDVVFMRLGLAPGETKGQGRLEKFTGSEPGKREVGFHPAQAAPVPHASSPLQKPPQHHQVSPVLDPPLGDGPRPAPAAPNRPDVCCPYFFRLLKNPAARKCASTSTAGVDDANVGLVRDI